MNQPRGALKGLVGVTLVILGLVIGLSVLMPGLSSNRSAAVRKAMQKEYGGYDQDNFQRSPSAAQPAEVLPSRGGKVETPLPRAVVKTFEANIDIMPRLSVGTATPESIYEARFEAFLEAKRPPGSAGECEILIPLPPQIISLADLKVEINADPSENVQVMDGYLLWRGALDGEAASKIHLAYSAVGKGIYTLEKPPGKIIDRFRTVLTAHQSDIRMLELSLQPKRLERKDNSTVYTWDYERLLVGRPIALDVLGISAVDRLGDIVWLGPLSVLVFGVLVSLMVAACRPQHLSVWTILLIVGCFAAAYPLMYFLQEFVPLAAAIFLAGGVAVVIIAVRAAILLGLRTGLLAGVLLPGAVMALAVAATVYPKAAVQGVLLTLLGILTLVVMMVLLPKSREAFAGEPPPLPPLAPPPSPPPITGE